MAHRWSVTARRCVLASQRGRTLGGLGADDAAAGCHSSAAAAEALAPDLARGPASATAGATEGSPPSTAPAIEHSTVGSPTSAARGSAPHADSSSEQIGGSRDASPGGQGETVTRLSGGAGPAAAGPAQGARAAGGLPGSVRCAACQAPLPGRRTPLRSTLPWGTRELYGSFPAARCHGGAAWSDLEQAVRPSPCLSHIAPEATSESKCSSKTWCKGRVHHLPC